MSFETEMPTMRSERTCSATISTRRLHVFKVIPMTNVASAHRRMYDAIIKNKVYSGISVSRSFYISNFYLGPSRSELDTRVHYLFIYLVRKRDLTRSQLVTT